MRRAVVAVLGTIGIVLSVIPPVTAQAFTGTMHFTIHDENGKTTNLTQATKPGHYAIQFMDAGKVAQFIVDSAAGTTTIVSSEDSSYFVITKEMAQMAGGMMQGMMGMARRGMDSSKADDDTKATITPAGTSVVAGIPVSSFTTLRTTTSTRRAMCVSPKASDSEWPTRIRWPA